MKTYVKYIALILLLLAAGPSVHAEQQYTDAQLKALREALVNAVDSVIKTLAGQTPPPTNVANVIPAHTATEFQTALDTAAKSAVAATIVLDSGVRYIGNFVLPVHTATTPITVTSTGGFPAAGVRITGSMQQLAIIETPNNVPAIAALTGANNYHFIGVAFSAGSVNANDIVRFGYGDEKSSDLYPRGFVLDRVIIRGSATAGAKRGVLANAHDVTLMNSDIRDIWRTGQDTTTFGCFNCGTGYVLRNNWLEAGAEVVIFGGAESVAKTVATDVLVEDNVLTRPIGWKGAAALHQVKNLFELKECLRCVIRRNHMFNNWAEAQPGTAFVITPRDLGKSITDVLIESNVIHDTGAGFSISSHDDHTVTPIPTSRIVFRNNLLIMNQPVYNGDGRLIIMSGGPQEITFDHNTVIQLPVTVKYGSLMAHYQGTAPAAGGTTYTGGPINGFKFTNNVAVNGEYGIIANGNMNGAGFLVDLPGAVFTGNVLAGYELAWRADAYPVGNKYPTLAEYQAMFVNFTGGDYRPSALMPLGTDGKPAGVDHAQLPIWK